MSRSAIRTTVQTAVDTVVADVPDYLLTPLFQKITTDAVNAICEALDGALDGAVDYLRAEAVGFGISGDDAEAAFATANLLHDPEPEALVDEPQDEEPVADVVSRAEFEALKAQVDAALAAARRQGVSI